MTPENIFSASNLIAMLGWVLLISLPRWRGTLRIVQFSVIPVLLAIIYLWLIATNISQSEGGFGSLAQVAQLFKNEKLLLAGWVHYLAFDLFVGSWELTDSQQRNISHWQMIPCLLLTFLFGPIGLLLYLAISFPKRIHQK